jgi:hypothetical protein
VLRPESRESGSLRICEDADGMTPARQRGARGETMIASERSVVGDFAADVVFGGVALCQNARDLQVNQTPSRL